MAAAISLALTFLALVVLRKAVASRRAAIGFALGILVLLLFLITYYGLNALTGSGIDESVLFHLGAGMKGATVQDFTAVIAVTALMLVAALVAAYVAFHVIRARESDTRTRVPILTGTAALLAAFAVNPTVLDVSDLAWKYGIKSFGDGSRVPAPPEYIAINTRDVKGADKNLVLLYLESVERTYMDAEIFPGLTPNLNALEREALSFTDMTQVTWASWTIGAMVASQCGIPLAGSGAGSDEFLPAATCMGDLLRDAGYDMTYMHGSSLEFAGWGTFYESHGFDLVEGADDILGQLDDPNYESIWGIYDDALLDLSARRFDEYAARDTPFGMVLLTVDTHHPEGGTVSDTCKDIIYADGANPFLNSIHCADHMAGEFIRHVLGNPAMEDTVLVVMSDHLSRPNSVWDTLEAAERRNLVLAFGAGIEPGRIDRPGTTFDLAPTFLGLLGADTQAMGYGRDLLGATPSLRSTTENLDQLLEEHWTFLSSLADFPQLDAGIRVDATAKKAYLGTRFVKLPAVFQLDEDLRVRDILYDLDDGTKLPWKLLDMWYGDRFVWVDNCARVGVFEGRKTKLPAEFCALAGSLGSPGLTSFPLSDEVPLRFGNLKSVFEHVTPDQAYYDSVVGAFRDNAFLIDADVMRSVAPSGLVGDFVIRSSGGSEAWESWVVNRDQGDMVYVERGITLLGLNSAAAPVKIAHKDTCAWGGEFQDSDVLLATDFGTAIDRTSNEYGAFVVVVHSSAVCGEVDVQLEELFAGTEFTRWPDVQGEQPYVAIRAGNGNITEFLGERNTALALELRDFLRQDTDGTRPLVLREVAEPEGVQDVRELTMPPLLHANPYR
ncbi:sulfatase-like hydrolase/transferase [Aliiroseovarius subalbicans]|uniref:sulfatase-like hydrolase/transferase n=1 Tax=Aliiroseovarius subalbicans TaxID=2925840 RepID=UPI001F577882|nr:sulfatase-like hydrolase/transferase [Aliiroseovarius subalbicans]MCI2400835.1 sulfatase-like hydrolase/transferase [Aliiroseovarius subalbicans]